MSIEFNQIEHGGVRLTSCAARVFTENRLQFVVKPFCILFIETLAVYRLYDLGFSFLLAPLFCWLFCLCFVTNSSKSICLTKLSSSFYVQWHHSFENKKFIFKQMRININNFIFYASDIYFCSETILLSLPQPRTRLKLFDLRNTHKKIMHLIKLYWIVKKFGSLEYFPHNDTIQTQNTNKYTLREV